MTLMKFLSPVPAVRLRFLDFIAASCLVLGASGCSAGSPPPSNPSSAKAASPSSAEEASLASAEAPTKTAEIGIFTSGVEGFDTHSFYYDTGKEVVVFDAQFTEPLARQLVDHIQKKTRSPIRYLVITHPNPDKFNGASVFREHGAQVVASQATATAIAGVHAYKKYFFVNMAKMFTEETYPAKPEIDVTFEREFSLPLEAGRVDLEVLDNAGVSSTQTVAYVPAAKALIVGDLVHHKAHAWLEGAIVNGQPHTDLDSWSRALDELLAYQGSTVYGGRGEPAPVEVAVTDSQAYLQRAEQEVTAYVSSLDNPVEELSGDRAPEHRKAIMRRMEAAYPNYGLPYMIEYGVYGLAGDVAKMAAK